MDGRGKVIDLRGIIILGPMPKGVITAEDDYSVDMCKYLTHIKYRC